MGKKNATQRHTTHFDSLGELIRGRPKHGKMHLRSKKRRGPARRK